MIFTSMFFQYQTPCYNQCRSGFAYVALQSLSMVFTDLGTVISLPSLSPSHSYIFICIYIYIFTIQIVICHKNAPKFINPVPHSPAMPSHWTTIVTILPAFLAKNLETSGEIWFQTSFEMPNKSEVVKLPKHLDSKKKNHGRTVYP